MFGIVLTRFPSKSKTSTWFAAGPETKTWWLASSTTLEPKPVAPSATDEPDPATADDPTIAPAATSTTIAVANLPSLPRIGVTLPSTTVNVRLNLTAPCGDFHTSSDANCETIRQ